MFEFLLENNILGLKVVSDPKSLGVEVEANFSSFGAFKVT